MQRIKHIAGYKFVVLTELSGLRRLFFEKCQMLALKGTILLSEEGVNIMLAGDEQNIADFRLYLQTNDHFLDKFGNMTFRESISFIQPYKQMKVKIKKEIITFGQKDIRPEQGRAPSLKPKELKQWLDKNVDIVIVDTRNTYEVKWGTFEKATHFHLSDFSEFPEKSEALKQLGKDKPIVTFCTGGIRCEKAALYLLKAGFKKVYQLEGGILNYFTEVGGDHYQGECFVFDNRVALDTQLHPTLR